MPKFVTTATVLKSIVIGGLAAFSCLHVNTLLRDLSSLQDAPAAKPEYHSMISKAYINENNALLKQGADIDAQAFNRNLQKALKLAPFSDDAFLQAALLNKVKNQNSNTADLLKTATLRNPRNTKANRLYLEHHLQYGSISDAVNYLDLLMRESVTRRDIYISMLVTLYNYPGADAQINGFLSENRHWGQNFISKHIQATDAAALQNSQGIIFDYVAKGKNRDFLLQQLINKYLDNGLQDEAYAIADTHHEKLTDLQASPSNFIFNAKFQPAAALYPFNWRLYNSKYAVVDFSGANGAYISIKRDADTLLARQTLKVPRETALAFSYKTQGNTTPRYGKFEWRILCSAARTPLSKLTVASSPKRQDSVEFNSGQCDFIDLEIWGLPGELSGRSSLNLVSAQLNAAKVN